MLENIEEYAKRREQFLKEIGDGGFAIVNAAKEIPRNGDRLYPYRQNSDFYYLTGFEEPDAVAVFIPNRPQGSFILFNRARNPSAEVWTGKYAGQEGACRVYGADQSFPITLIDEELPKLMENRQRIYYAIAQDMSFNRRVLTWVSKAKIIFRGPANTPTVFINIETILHEMRLHKSATEQALMRKASEISAAAHCRAMQLCKPGMMEYELEAEIQYIFTQNGSQSPAYNHIVGSGENSCVLHYNANNKKIKPGELVLIDAGAEYQYYAADITRTFPANGRFTEAQRAIYEIVLSAQMQVISIVKPKTRWNELEQMAERVMTKGLIDVGILSGKLEELLKNKAVRRFYLHSIGHWLGLDVHDVGKKYGPNGESRLLEPGMVLTVEPGIYIPSDSDGVDKKWWGIGVRIEDDVLVTEQGHEVLTSGVPKTVEEIETLMTK